MQTQFRLHLVCCFFCALCAVCGQPVCRAQAVHGISLADLHRRGFGYGSDEARKQLKAIADIGANWVAFNEFAYMTSVDDPHVHFNRDGNEEQMKQAIADAHAAGLKVLLKPHIWSRQFYTDGKWAGDIAMKSDADWDSWFAEYSEFILRSARIGQAAGAETLSIGCEYKGTSSQEARWRKLIAKVREVYKGHLTYASAFWDAPDIKFWDALDCIGIDAYYPLSDSELASDEQLRAGWAKVYDKLAPLSRQWGKPICFTELGYTDSARAAIEPWSWNVVRPDPSFQARLYRVALDEASKRDFVVGLFVWKWFTSDQWKQMERHENFCVQDNPLVIAELKRAWKGATTQPTE